MASMKHQFIMDCIVRKMRYLGFEPVSFDGKSTLVSSLKVPPKVRRHRPDIIGVNIKNDICLGEAKTEDDINSKRTMEQLIAYTTFGACTIVGCPASASSKLNKKIDHLALKNRVLILNIPNELMPDEELPI